MPNPAPAAPIPDRRDPASSGYPMRKSPPMAGRSGADLNAAFFADSPCTVLESAVFPNQMHRHGSSMWMGPMLPKVDTLPGAQGQRTPHDRETEVDTR